MSDMFLMFFKLYKTFKFVSIGINLEMLRYMQKTSLKEKKTMNQNENVQ